jgi:hypothetical protein
VVAAVVSVMTVMPMVVIVVLWLVVLVVHFLPSFIVGRTAAGLQCAEYCIFGITLRTEQKSIRRHTAGWSRDSVVDIVKSVNVYLIVFYELEALLDRFL